MVGPLARFIGCRARASALLVAVLLFLPMAWAGSSTSPDFVDDSNDGLNHTTGLENDLGRLDIVAAWMEHVGSDQVAFSIQVRDLEAFDAAGAFGDAAGPQIWNWEFDVDDLRLQLWVWQDAEGDSYVEVAPVGSPRGGGLPASRANSLACEDHAAASVTFDDGSNTITATLDRNVTFREGSFCPGQPASATHTLDLGSGLSNHLVSTMACDSGDVVASPGPAIPSCSGHTIDRTVPAEHLLFKHTSNQFLESSIPSSLSVPVGESGSVSVAVTNPTGVPLEASLRFVAPDGWTVQPAVHAVEVAPGATLNAAFDFTASPSAKTGMALLQGAGLPSELLLIAGDLAFSTAGQATLPVVDEAPVDQAELYLYALATVNPDRQSGVKGDIIDTVPFDNAESVLTKELAGTTPFGIWASEELMGHIALSSEASFEAPFEWTGAGDAQFTALLGADLPLDWDGEEELPGVAVLEATGDGGDAGSGMVTFTGSTSGVVIGPREDIELAIYATGTGGSASLTVYDDAQPAKLMFGYTSPILTAALRQTGQTNEFLATVVTSAPLVNHEPGPDAALQLQGAVMGDTSSAVVDLVYASTSGLTETSEDVVTFTDGQEAEYLVSVPVTGPAMSIDIAGTELEGNLWVTVEGVRDTGSVAPIAHDRSPGVDKSILLAPLAGELLQYEALNIYLEPRGISSGDVTVMSTADEELALPGALRVHSALLTPGSGTTGPLNLNAEGPAVSVPVVHTESGPTVAPISGFVPSAPAVHAGNAVTFLDRSHDPEGALASWAWNFGDEATSTEQNPTHRYTTPGSYPVTLTVHDAFGAESKQHTFTITVLEPGAPLPKFTPPRVGTAIPAQGTAGYYANLYTIGSAHLEDYHAGWARHEVEGLLGQHYLPASEPQAYVFGSIADDRLKPTWNDAGFTFNNHVGATVEATATDVTQSIDTAWVRATHQGSAFPQDGGRDGHILTDDGVRTLSLLAGTIHTDIRSELSVSTTEFDAPAGNWLAYGTRQGVQVMPVANANGLTVPAMGGNQWFAVFDPTTDAVVGAVLSGRLQSAELSWSEGLLTVTGEHEAAAQYLTAYRTTVDDATRYAGVQQLARMDREELGIAYLTGDVSAARAWAGATDTSIVAGEDPKFKFPDAFIGQEPEWSLNIETSELEKTVRVIMPASYTDGDSASSEGQPPRSEFQDEDTYVGNFEFDGATPMQVGAPGILMPLLLVWGIFAIILAMLLIPAVTLTKKFRGDDLE